MVTTAGEEETDRRLMRLMSLHWEEQPGIDHPLFTYKNQNLKFVSSSELLLTLNSLLERSWNNPHYKQCLASISWYNYWRTTCINKYQMPRKHLFLTIAYYLTHVIFLFLFSVTAAEPSPPQPPPLVSRCTQTSTAAPESFCSQTHTVRSRTHPSKKIHLRKTPNICDWAINELQEKQTVIWLTLFYCNVVFCPSVTAWKDVAICTMKSTRTDCVHHAGECFCVYAAGQQPGVSVQVCETADEPDSRSQQAPLCPQCLSSQRGRAGGNEAPYTLSSKCSVSFCVSLLTWLCFWRH